MPLRGRINEHLFLFSKTDIMGECYSTEGGDSVENRGKERARQARWDRRNLRTVSTHVSVGQARRFGRFCRRYGSTPYAELRGFVLRCCDQERMREIANSEKWPD